MRLRNVNNACSSSSCSRCFACGELEPVLLPVYGWGAAWTPGRRFTSGKHSGDGCFCARQTWGGSAQSLTVALTFYTSDIQEENVTFVGRVYKFILFHIEGMWVTLSNAWRLLGPNIPGVALSWGVSFKWVLLSWRTPLWEREGWRRRR